MILFLDYDGVLHPDEVFRLPGGEIVLRTDKLPDEYRDARLFCYMPALEAILEDFLEVRIVLSTSWVPGLGYSKAVRRLSPALQRRVIGSTWHSKYTPEWGQVSRFYQILDHVSRHHLGQHWLALDNDAQGWPDIAFDNLVLCHDYKGLGDPETQADLRRKLSAYYDGLRK